MDAFQLLEDAGVVPPADEAVIESAVAFVTAAATEGLSVARPSTIRRRRSTSELVPPTATWRRRRQRQLALAGSSLLAASAAAVVAAVVIAPGGAQHAPPAHRLVGKAPGPAAPTVLTASTVRLISADSAAAVDSGTAVETSSFTDGSIQSASTVDVTFSGQNVNYLITTDGNGAGGVQNRVVDGQLYLYVKGPDLQMHWYRDTGANASSSPSFPDPRTLLQAISPSAGLTDLGSEQVGGVELTHLRASTPSGLGKLGIPDVTGKVTSFNFWIDSDNVVRQMAVVSSGYTGESCQDLGPSVTHQSSSTSTLPKATRKLESAAQLLKLLRNPPAGTVCRTTTSTSTLDVTFANLGAPETITAPAGATEIQAKG